MAVDLFCDFALFIFRANEKRGLPVKIIGLPFKLDAGEFIYRSTIIYADKF